MAIVGPRVEKRVPRVCFDEIVSGERRSSEREKDPSLSRGLHCGIIVYGKNAFCNRQRRSLNLNKMHRVREYEEERAGLLG